MACPEWLSSSFRANFKGRGDHCDSPVKTAQAVFALLQGRSLRAATLFLWVNCPFPHILVRCLISSKSLFIKTTDIPKGCENDAGKRPDADAVPQIQKPPKTHIGVRMSYSIRQLVIPQKISKGEVFIACISYATQPTFSMPLSFEILGFEKAPAVGTRFVLPYSGGEAFAEVLEVGFQPDNGPGLHARNVMRLEALRDIPTGVHTIIPERPGPALAWITLSDKCSKGERKDISGPLIPELLGKKFSFSRRQGYLLPDDPSQLSALLMNLTVTQGYDFVITTGGTGLSPRDTTPEAALRVIERRLPGFEQIMMRASLKETPYAALSRAVAGTVGASLVLCLPGGEKAVRTTLTAVLPALEHALTKLQGDTRDCA